VRAERGKQARETYYDAVFQELAARGYHGMTVEGIVRRAGGSRGRFYHHFDNKHDALVQTYRAQTQAWVRDVRDAMGRGATVEQALSGALLQLVRVEPATLPIALLEMHLLAARDLEIRKIIASDYETKLNFTAELIRGGMQTGELRAGLDAVMCAHQLYSAVCGLCLVHFGTGCQHPLDEPVATALRLLFDALRTPACAE
jgi:TetR/AcrR family transcriptional repressor of nem operon